MAKSIQDLRVILIGGTSHAGKSTLAQALAEQLGWQYRSTDYLARHPGRPWAMPPNEVRPHVAEHYLTLSVDELITDVLRHYRETIWPMANPLIESHATDPNEDRLVLEGSALWPEQVAGLSFDNVAALWLTASPSFLQERMYTESQYAQKNPREKKMIDQFLRRTVVYNERMLTLVKQLELPYLDIEQCDSLADLTAQSLALLTELA
jgi:2-phosphoglycerate kinase